jgi:hypothetical protein
MGTVISIEEWRERHRAELDDPAERLEQAVAELDDVLQELPASRRSEQTIERELLAITGAVSIGMLEDAAERAERLRERLLGRARKGS